MIKESKLIFIISQPRAGSTLTQKLLSNNNSVDTVSEPWLLLPLLSVYRSDLITAKYNYQVALSGLFDYLRKKNVEVEFKNDLKKNILNLYNVQAEHQYFIDKTPRYYEILPEIISFFPEAKFLILKRNPFASLHSMLSTWSEGKIDFELMKNFYRDFLVAPFLIQHFCDRHGSLKHVFQVKYEDIVNSPDLHVSKIYQWLEIPFSKEALNIQLNDKVKGIYGDDVYNKKPLAMIKSENSNSWISSVLSNRTITYFFHEYQKYLSGDFLLRYGYEMVNFKKTNFALSRNLFRDFLKEVQFDQKSEVPPSE